MVKAMRRIGEYLKLIDIVIEVVDARAAHSGRNPMLDQLVKRRSRVLALNREDLAEPRITKRWVETFERSGLVAIAVDGRNPGSVARIASVVARFARERGKPSRAIVVGLPNAGKSSIINGLLRRAAAKTEDRAGITRQLQWYRLSANTELMDTPGILVPKIATRDAQWKLAVCGAVPDDRYDAEHVSAEFHRWVSVRHPRARVPDLGAFATARGFLRRGGAIDEQAAARSYVRALQRGDFGRFSFESPEGLE